MRDPRRRRSGRAHPHPRGRGDPGARPRTRPRPAPQGLHLLRGIPQLRAPSPHAIHGCRPLTATRDRQEHRHGGPFRYDLRQGDVPVHPVHPVHSRVRRPAGGGDPHPQRARRRGFRRTSRRRRARAHRLPILRRLRGGLPDRVDHGRPRAVPHRRTQGPGHGALSEQLPGPTPTSRSISSSPARGAMPTPSRSSGRSSPSRSASATSAAMSANRTANGAGWTTRCRSVR